MVLTTAAKEPESTIPELDMAKLMEPTGLAQAEDAKEDKPKAAEEAEPAQQT